MDKEHIKVKRLYSRSVPDSRSLREDESTTSPPTPQFLVRGRNGGDVATFSLVQIKKDKNEEEIGDYNKQMENSAISIFAYKWPLFSDTILSRRLATGAK